MDFQGISRGINSFSPSLHLFCIGFSVEQLIYLSHLKQYFDLILDFYISNL